MHKRTNYHKSHWFASRLNESTAAPVYKPSLRGWPRSRASTILRVHPRRSSRRCLHWRKRAWREASGFFSSRNQRARPDSVQCARPSSSLWRTTSIKVTFHLMDRLQNKTRYCSCLFNIVRKRQQFWELCFLNHHHIGPGLM